MDSSLATTSGGNALEIDSRLEKAAKNFIVKYKFATPPQFLVAAYEYFLNRSIDEEGYNNWLIQLYSGLDRAQVVRAFLDCEEFRRVHTDRAPLRVLEENIAEQTVPDRSSLEQYQDIWCKGQVQKKGIRECEDRFQLISEFCKQYSRPFTVLDIGSNLGYFSLRLTERFDCTAVALEGVYGNWLQEVLEANQNRRVILLKRLFKLDDLRKLAEVEHFDLVLGLSVIHHLDGAFNESLEVLRSLGDHVILELPFESNACGQTIVEQVTSGDLPPDAKLLGFGKSHLQVGQRPIYFLSRPKTKLKKSFLGTGRSDLSLSIQSDFHGKRVEFHNKEEKRDWLRGINLQTYLWFNGCHPTRSSVADAIEALGPPSRLHRDVQPWNIILSGDAVHYIDFDDPNHGLSYSDEDYLKRLLCLLRATPTPIEKDITPPAENSKAKAAAPLPRLLDSRIERVACPFCSSTAAQPFRKLADIVKCDGCDTVYLRTRATTEAMEELYQSYGNEGSHIALPKLDEQVVTSVLRRDPFLREILQFTEAGGKLLDVGCGWGAFLFNARQYGFEPTGLEITRRAAAYANGRLGIPVVHTQFLDTEYEAESLQVVTMLHVLEHLPQPRQALAKAFACLRPGGLFCGMVPNIESFCSTNQADEWFWLDPNYHYVHYSPATLRQHLENAGFLVERIYTTKGDYRLDFIRQLALARQPDLKDDAAFQQFVSTIEASGQGEEVRFFARKPGRIFRKPKVTSAVPSIAPAGSTSRVSVIMPVLANDPHLFSRVATLSKHPSVAEIIVVDSPRCTAVVPANERIRCVHAEKGASVAALCNQAAQSAASEYLVFADPSLEPDPFWLEHGIARLDRDPNVGVVGSKLLYPDRSVQHAGIELFARVHSAEYLLPQHRYRRFPEGDPMVNRGEPVWAVSFASLFVRRSVFQQAGGFTPEFAEPWLAAIDLCLKVRHAGQAVWYEPASTAILATERAIPTPSETLVNIVRPLLRKWQPDILRSELETYVARRDGKFCYFSEDLLPDLPDAAWDSARLQSVAERLFRLLPALEPFQVHFGGAGDALLLMSTFYDKGPARSVVSFPNSIAAARSFFEAFPNLENVYFLPPASSARVHVMLRVLLKRLPNCLGLGVTPETDYFQEWCEGLDIFSKYGVHPSPEWAKAFKRTARPCSIALAPKGSLSGMVGSKRNLIPVAHWPEVIRFVQSCGYTPVVLGTPDERSDYPALPGCEDQRSFSFREQMEAIASCDMFVGADSWGKTFAALAGLPAIVFEPVKGRDWSGRRDASDYVFLDPWENIQVVSDVAAFKEAFWKKISESAVSEQRASRFLTPNLQRIPPASPSKLKIAWEGSFSDCGSLSHVNRSLTCELPQSLQITLVEPPWPPKPAGSQQPRSDSTVRSKIRAQAPPHMDVTVRHGWPPRWNPPTSGAWVLIQPWEFGSLPLDWLPHLQKVDEIWAPTEYVRRVYIDSGVAPHQVKVVPNGIDPAVYRPDAPPMQLPTRKRFKFLFVGGTVPRKGPDVLLKSYLDTFTAADDVCLVIKEVSGGGVYVGQTMEAEIETARANPNAAEILYLRDEMDNMAGLFTACDCLVHPYRGEGFGLPVLEAMACGLPVIVTAGGATDDFATDAFVYRIGASRKRLGSRLGTIQLARPGWWLEPSAIELGERMRWMTGRPDEVRNKAQRASEFVRQHWTWKRAAQIADARLQDLVARKAAERAAIQARRTRKITVVDLPPVASIGYLGQAREHFRARQFAPAWNATIKAIQQRPFHPEGWLLLAEIAQADGDIQRARECALRARDLAPKWKAARKFIASLPANVTRAPSDQGLEPIPAKAATRLSVCIIAKNEEAFLGQCLASVKGLADEIIVVDTGSVDNTVSIAREHGAQVHSFAWTDDFSAARNFSLQHATGDWVLILDADEELPPASHDALRREINTAAVMAYRLPIVDHGKEDEGCSYVPRLFRNAPGLFFVGRIHEQVFTSIEVLRPQWDLENRLATASILHYGYAKAISTDRGKNARNLKLLKKAVEELPNEPHLLMSYGLELVRSGDVEAGLEQYWEAFHVLSAHPSDQVVPELREMLLSQLSTQLTAAKAYREVVAALTSPLARTGGLTASLHFTLGLALIELRQFSEAAEQMRHCLAKRDQPALSPINKEIRKAAPRHCLALCLKFLNQPKEAAKVFRQAIDEEPQSIPVRLDYARFLAVGDTPVESLQLIHQLISERPEEISGWLLGGQIALSRPEFVEFARDWTGESIKVFPDNEIVVTQRIQALLLNGNVIEALTVARAVQGCRNPSLAAGQILCEIISGNAANTDIFSEPNVSNEFVGLYRLLLSRDCAALVHLVNQSLSKIRAVLPSAARVLEQALEQAAIAA